MSGPSVKVVLRTVVGIALLGWLLSALDPSEVARSLRAADWRWVAGGLAAQLVAKFVWAARWRRILLAGGVRRGFWDLLALVHMGLFFNSFLPTSVGGDLVRGYYASGSGGKTASYAALLVERGIGFVAMLAVGGVAAFLALFEEAPPFPPPILVGVALVAGLAVALGLLIPRVGWVDWISGRLASRGGRLARLAPPLSESSRLFRTGASSPAIVGWSIALQFVAVLFHVACARAVGIEVPLLDFFLIVPASVVASMIPISLNGLGIREGVLVALTTVRGAGGADAGGFALLALLLSTLFAGIGGILYALGMLGRIGGRSVASRP